MGRGPDDFCSGSGTSSLAAVSPYINLITGLAQQEGFFGLSFVDLGCGDFRVGQQLLPLCPSYIGIDIVKPLIENNREKFNDAKVNFLHLNIIKDDLPAGDLCLVMQVLQHLSNAEIIKILEKLSKYRWVFISEHDPDDHIKIIPN